MYLTWLGRRLRRTQGPRGHVAALRAGLLCTAPADLQEHIHWESITLILPGLWGEKRAGKPGANQLWALCACKYAAERTCWGFEERGGAHAGCGGIEGCDVATDAPGPSPARGPTSRARQRANSNRSCPRGGGLCLLNSRSWPSCTCTRSLRRPRKAGLFPKSGVAGAGDR